MANEIKDIYDNPESEDYKDKSLPTTMSKTKTSIFKKGTLSHSSSKKKVRHHHQRSNSFPEKSTLISSSVVSEAVGEELKRQKGFLDWINDKN